MKKSGKDRWMEMGDLDERDFGVGNIRRLHRFRFEVGMMWRGKGKPFNGERYLDSIDRIHS
jgi:hypothetical protein